MLVGFNKRGEGWYLALVFVEGDTVDGPHYVAAPFDREPGWAETSVNLSIPDLLGNRAGDTKQFDGSKPQSVYE